MNDGCLLFSRPFFNCIKNNFDSICEKCKTLFNTVNNYLVGIFNCINHIPSVVSFVHPSFISPSV